MAPSHSSSRSTSHLQPPTLVRPSGPDRTSSHTSHRSQKSLPLIHPQPHDVYIGPDTMGVDFDALISAEVMEQNEDRLFEEEQVRSSATSRAGSRAPKRLDNDSAGSSENDGIRSRSKPAPNGLFDDNLSRRRSVTFNDNLGQIPKISLPSHDLDEESGVSQPASPFEQPDGGMRTKSSSLDWDAIREGSIARRARWRKPSVYWLMPFVFVFALVLGSCIASKQELFINLACLAHPPQSQSEKAVPSFHTTGSHDAVQYNSSSTFTSVSYHLGGTLTPLPPLTPADKWMLEVQRRIAADKKERERQRKIAAGLPIDDEPSTQPSSYPGGSMPVATSTSTLPAPSQLPHPPHGPAGGLPAGSSPAGQGSDDDVDTGTSPANTPESDPSTQDGPRPGEIDPRLCKKDPVTQGAAARLTMIMGMAMGLLSAITTGFWGSFSDKFGRTRVMGLAVFGLIFSDIILIIVATYPHLVPGGYRFLILGPVVDGLLGGFSTITATNHAYISDVTPDGSRAKTFSRFAGVTMSGFAFGPLFGSFMVRWTGNIMTPFYIGVCINTFFMIYAFLILPESLSTEARAALVKIAASKALVARQQEQAEIDWENTSDVSDEDTSETSGLLHGAAVGGDSGWSRLSTRTNGTTSSSKRSKKMYGALKRLRRRAFAFLAPLAMFLPRDKMVNGVMRKDYNLMYLALGAFFGSMLMGVLQLKSQFLIFRYGWTSVELGEYLTMLGALRASVLLVFFPLLVRLIKPVVLATIPGSTDPAAPPLIGPGYLRSAQALADTKFDLSTLRFSLMFDTFAYFAMAFMLPVGAFVFMTAMVTIGSAGNSASQSLALNLIDSSREAGKLFGAISVVSALGSAFIGPLLFSTTYIYTIGSYPPAIFAVATGMLVLAQICLWGIRLPGLEIFDKGKKKATRDVERGRTKRVKRVNSSSISRG